jgi:hypothetical protein
MGYVEVKHVKEYIIHIRDDKEMAMFIGVLVNCNPANKDMVTYRDGLLESCRSKKQRPLDSQGLPDLKQEPK